MPALEIDALVSQYIPWQKNNLKAIWASTIHPALTLLSHSEEKPQKCTGIHFFQKLSL